MYDRPWALQASMLLSNAPIVGLSIWFGAYFNSGMLTQALREGQAGDRCKSWRFPW